MESLSKKLQVHMEKPLYLVSDGSRELPWLEEFSINKKRFAIALDVMVDPNGLVKINGFRASFKGVCLGIMDALCEFLNGKEFYLVASLNLREFESYLRDRNDKPAYSGVELEEEGLDAHILRRVQMCLAKAVGSYLGAKVEESEPIIAYSEKMDLADKIKALKKLLELVYCPFFGQFQIALEFCELWECQLYYQIKVPVHRDSPGIRVFFHDLLVHSLSGEEGLATLNWVAEPE